MEIKNLERLLQGLEEQTLEPYPPLDPTFHNGSLKHELSFP